MLAFNQMGNLGRLGNQMFQYAALLGLANETGHTPVANLSASDLPDCFVLGSIEDKINYFLYSEINPSLASHGGEVHLVEVLEDTKVVLRFGGGCQGCGMVDLTLRDGVEKTLKNNIPELTEIIDSTDHSQTENAYYK